MSRKGSSYILVLVTAAAVLGGFLVSRQLATPPPPQLASGTSLPAPRAVAPFSLTDHAGAVFDNSRLHGAPHLVFFGFTHCPDVCPTTLALIAQLARGPEPPGITPLFVTVDPARDDQQTLRRYVEAFGGGLVGLRGEPAALGALTTSLGAAWEVAPLPGGGVRVDHTATLYYLDAQGRLAAVFTPPFSLPKLRADLAALSRG